MSNLSYREKTLYASFVTELIVYGSYFVLRQHNSVNNVAGMIGAIIVLQIVLQGIIAAVTRNRITDERDRFIELRGYRAGYLMLATLMVLGLGMLWLHTIRGDFPIESHMVGLQFLSVFFSMLVIADITKTAAQIVAYRRAL